jgi:DNA-binding transcriptional MerR regulator
MYCNLFAAKVVAMQNSEGWSSNKVCRIIGISYRQLDYWARSGFIKPSLKAASGSGTRRVYGFNDLIRLKVAKRLRDSGVSLKKIKKSLKYLKGALPSVFEPLTEMVFITDGQSIFNLTNDKMIIVDTLRNGQLTWNFNVDQVVNEIQERINSLEESQAL